MGIKREESTPKRLKTEHVEDDGAIQMDVDEPEVEAFSKDLLRMYYDRLFPYEQFIRWISYDNDAASEDPLVEKDFLSKREFSMTVDDIYMRYKSYKDVAEFAKDLKDKNPEKIDIGPVYSAPPKNKGAVKPSEFKPVERELIFDIDMDDYDSVRECCKGAKLCQLCWKFMSAAVRTLEILLRDCFGFKHILYVYSGRRGVHCWVCDTKARKLPDNARDAITRFLHIFKKGQNMELQTPLHPAFQRVKDEVLEDMFYEIAVVDQHKFDSADKEDSILNFIPDNNIRSALAASWNQDLSTLQESARVRKASERWESLKRTVEDQVTNKRNRRLKDTINNIIFSHTYPRLDFNVSTHMNHLLKSPFCVHPKTGRVCVPIDPRRPETFDFEQVPTIGKLQEEINSYDADRMGNQDQDIAKTSLQPIMASFEKQFLKPLQNSIREERLLIARSKEAQSLAW